MAVLWLSGSAEPGASVNVAPGEEKSLCPGAVGDSERSGRRDGARRLWVKEIAKGSVCKRIRTGAELGVWCWGTGWGPLGGTWL